MMHQPGPPAAGTMAGRHDSGRLDGGLRLTERAAG
jgi:hypothetical protein